MQRHKTSSRRGFLQAAIPIPAVAGLASDSGAAAPATANVYTRLGVRPFINAGGTLTNLSGTLMPPQVVQAMKEAYNLKPGEEIVIADRVRQILTSKA
jgi:L-seryl-tRNA(Ser) seleniumtransferase